jgi:hypothetical protein
MKIMKIKSINPANGETLKIHNEMTPAEAASAVRRGARYLDLMAENHLRRAGAADEARCLDSP